MTEAPSPIGRDFNDAANDLGDDAIRDAIITAGVQPTFPAGFSMSAKGLVFEAKSDQRLVAGKFEILAQTRDKNSQSWGLLIGWLDDDGVAHRVAVPRSLLVGDGLTLRQLFSHGGLYLSPHAQDRQLLQQFLSQVKTPRRARAVSRIGWQDGSFALPDRTIEAGSSDLVVYQGSGTLDHEFRAQGTLVEWQDAVARLAKDNSRLIVALCAAFVGPLLAAVGAEGGGLHLRGPSSIGKSTALLVAASVWGPPSFVSSWRATANGLEGVAEKANDCLLILDELAQLDPKEAGHVAYLLANGRGKSRASQSGEARAARHWLTFFLSSGEISLAEHGRSEGRGRPSPAGQEVRILDIEADAGTGLGLFDTLHGYASGDELARALKNGAAEHHGIAGPVFVQRLIGRLDELARDVRHGMDGFAKSCLPENATGQVARTCDRFALIAMAGELAVAEGILPWPPGTAFEAAKELFLGWIEARGGDRPAEDSAAIKQVIAFLTAHGSSRFQSLRGGDALVPNRAGFWREDAPDQREYLIPSSTWRNEVCLGLNPKRVAALLVERGYILPDGSGKASRSVAAPGMGKARFYIISQSIFEDGDA